MLFRSSPSSEFSGLIFFRIDWFDLLGVQVTLKSLFQYHNREIGRASWRERVETDRFIFLGSKISVTGDCSHEIKVGLLLERKAMTNLDSVLKRRGVTLPTKVCLVKAVVFPVVMYGCECWTIKKAERQIIDSFEVWCWRRLLRVTWTPRRSNQSILKEISPECSLDIN